MVTKAMRDTQCWSNLYLIISKLKGLHFQLKRRPQGKKVTKQLNVTKLKTLRVNDLQSAMNRNLSNLPTLSNDIEEAWASFRDTVHSIALKVLGPTTRKHQDWFEGNDAVIQMMYYLRKIATYFEPTRATWTDPGEISWTLWQFPKPPLYNRLYSHWTPFTGSSEPGTRLSLDDWRSGESTQANVHQGNLRIGHNLCWVVQGWWLRPTSPDHPPLLVLLGQRATPSKALEL